MNLDKQVCSLELAKRLKDLNVNQESLFCWCGEGEHIKIMLNSIYDAECNPNLKICSAFTIAELGEILPEYIDIHLKEDNGFDTIRYQLIIHKFDDTKTWSIEYYEKKGELVMYECHSEADARAKMLIYLLENGLLKNDNLHPA